MSQSRLLGIVVALVVLAAALWGTGLLSGGAPVAPPAPIDAPANATAAPATAEAATAAAADAAAVAKTEADAAAARVAVAPGTGTALIGRVVDDKSQPVAGAEVAAMPDFGFAGGDLEDLSEGFDMDRMAQRWRELEAQRVAVTTDAGGAFRIVPSGTQRRVNLTVKARGFEVLHREEQRPERGDNDVGALSLQSGAIVSGRVVDQQSRPVAGARVSRQMGGGAEFLGDFDPGFEGAEAMTLSENMMGSTSALTDADGRFEIASMPAGEFTLQARHAAFPTARTDKLQLAAGATRSDLLIAFGPAATIRGTLANVPDGQKDIRVMARAPRAPRGGEAQEGVAALFGGDLGGAMDEVGMQVGERSCKPEADGSFTLQGLKAGQSYKVWAMQGGRGFGLGALCSQRVEVAAGSSGIELRYDLGITVSLQVVDAKTGAPIEDLFVRDRLVGGARGFGDFMQFMPSNRRSQHYPEGRVAVANLRPKKDQTLTLTLDALGHERWQREAVALPQSGNLDLGTVRLDPVPVLRVQVLDQKSGRPIAGARVRLREQAPERDPAAAAAAADPREAFDAALEAGAADRMGGPPTHTAKTDAAGWCTLNAARRSATLAVGERNHAPLQTESFEPSASGDAERTLRMVRGGTVEVTVLDGSGAPQKGMRVEHRGGDGTDLADGADLADAMPFGNRGETDANGVARFEHLPPGEHSFRLGGRSGAGAVAFAIGNMQGRGDAPYTSVQVADEATATLELRADATASVHGVVRENGLAVEGARVSLLPAAGDAAGDAGAAIADQFEGMLQGGLARDAGLARTGADGSYQLNNTKIGEHRLRVRLKGRAMPTVVPVTLAAGDNAVDVDLDTTALRGVVVDAKGLPVAKAKVRVQRAPKEKASDSDAAVAFGAEAAMEVFGQAGGGAGEVTTGDDGTFELRGVECDVPLVVRARAKGFVDALSAPVEVARGAEHAGIRLQLGSGGTVKVKLAEARPFTMVQARYLGDEKDVKPVMKMMQGSSCTLDGLRPGRWEISLQASPFDRGAKVQPSTVDVAVGAEVTVELR